MDHEDIYDTMGSGQDQATGPSTSYSAGTQDDPVLDLSRSDFELLKRVSACSTHLQHNDCSGESFDSSFAAFLICQLRLCSMSAWPLRSCSIKKSW